MARVAKVRGVVVSSGFNARAQPRYVVKATGEDEQGNPKAVRLADFVVASAAVANGREQAEHYAVPLTVAPAVRRASAEDRRLARG